MRLLLLAILSVLIFLLGLLIGRNMTGPVIYEDGLGYLANARFLAGDGPVPELAPMFYYYPGYSALLSPLYMLSLSAEHVFRGVIVINAALGVAQFLLGFVLLSRLLNIRQTVAVCASFVAALYPGVLLLESYEYADNLFRVILLLGMVAAGFFFKRPTVWRAVALGAISAGALAVHPRGLGVVAATSVLLLIAMFGGGHFRAAIAGGAALVSLVIGVRLLNEVLIEAMYQMDDRSVGGMIGRLFIGEFWTELPIRAAGQLWYLTVATGGLFVVGAVVAWKGAWRGFQGIGRKGWPSSGEGAQLHLVMSATALFAISVIGMTDVSRPLQRLDHLIYGRYNDSFSVLFVMLGAAYILERWSGVSEPVLGHIRRPTVVAIVVLGLSALVLQFGGARLLASGQPYAPISAIGISVFAGDATALPVGLATLAGALLVTLGLVVLPRVSAYLSVGLFCVVFVSISFIAEAGVLRQFNSQWMNLLSLQDSVRYLGEPVAIGYDESGLSLHGLNGYQFWLDEVDFVTFDSRIDDVPDLDLVIASEEWDRADEVGARLAAIELNLDQGLWVLPGPMQDEMMDKGQLLASDPTEELPPEAMSSKIEIVEGPEPGSLIDNDSSLVIRTRVQHLGQGSPWTPLGAWAPDQVTGATRLVARWIPAGQAEVSALQIAELPRTVMPGEEVEVDIEVSPAAEDGPLPAGRYVLRLGLVQEGYGWFEERGDPPLDLELSVLDS
jgi:hypothetical protein